MCKFYSNTICASDTQLNSPLPVSVCLNGVFLTLALWTKQQQFFFCIYSIRFTETETYTTHGFYFFLCFVYACIGKSMSKSHANFLTLFFSIMLRCVVLLLFSSRRGCVYFSFALIFEWLPPLLMLGYLFLCFPFFTASAHTSTHYHMPAAARCCDDSKYLSTAYSFSNAIYLTDFTFNFFYYLCFDFFVILSSLFLIFSSFLFFSFCSLHVILFFLDEDCGFSFLISFFRQLLKF